MNTSTQTGGSRAEDLCLECGLCCNGVIFARLKLQPEDSPPRLRELGLPVSMPKTPRGKPQLSQPCAAFDGCRCRVYAERPRYCREFECRLLQSVKGGRTASAAALETIRTARERVRKVRGLLRELGDRDEATALSLRFRQTARRMEETALDRETTSRFGELTLAMHDLNLLLSEAFYPGPG